MQPPKELPRNLAICLPAFFPLLAVRNSAHLRLGRSLGFSESFPILCISFPPLLTAQLRIDSIVLAMIRAQRLALLRVLPLLAIQQRTPRMPTTATLATHCDPYAGPVHTANMSLPRLDAFAAFVAFIVDQHLAHMFNGCGAVGGHRFALVAPVASVAGSDGAHKAPPLHRRRMHCSVAFWAELRHLLRQQFVEHHLGRVLKG